MLVSARHPAIWSTGMALMWLVVFFSMISAVSYFRKFWRKIDARIKERRRRELLQLESKRQRERRRQMGAAGGVEGLGGTIWKPPEVN